MGVKWVLRWKPFSGPSPEDEKLLNLALYKLDARGDRSNKRVEVKCNLLRQLQPPEAAMVGRGPGQAGMRDMWLVQTSDAGETCYLLNRQDCLVLEADNEMLRVVDGKLDYKVRATVRLEGRRYVKGDFAIKVATATQTTVGATGSAGFLGHVLEVDYAPLSCPTMASRFMDDFMTVLRGYLEDAAAFLGYTELPGSLEPVVATYNRYPMLPPTFSRAHAATLYTELATAMLTVQQ